MLKAFDVKDSKGRRDPYDEDLLINGLDLFLADYLKLLQSKSYRRLADKTQVRCSPENPHVRTRNVHTQEVIAVSATISELLGLNTNLCMAIAAGHDIGHTPYGHISETILTELGGKTFRHEKFGVIVAQDIERKGLGLNLDYETLEGILFHSRGSNELKITENKPHEYNVVMYADKIAYLFSDLNDAIRYGYLSEGNIPACVNKIGLNQRIRINSCIEALIKESKEKDKISFSEGKEFQIFSELKDFMFNNVYKQVDWDIHKTILRKAYSFFGSEFPEVDPVISIALLTDREINSLSRFFLETRKPDMDYIKHFGVFEILPYIKDKKIDYSNPKLDWENKK